MDAPAPSKDTKVARDASFIRNPVNASTDSLEFLPNYQLFQSGGLLAFGSDAELLSLTDPTSSTTGDRKSTKKSDTNFSGKTEFHSEPTRRRASLSPDDVAFSSGFPGMKPSSPSQKESNSITKEYSSLAKSIVEEREQSVEEYASPGTRFNKNLTSEQQQCRQRTLQVTIYSP